MKQILIFLFLLYCLTPRVYSQNAPLKLGAERMDVVTRLLKGKRIGLVVNQTSILEKRQIHLLDALVAEDIDVGSPHGQSLITFILSFFIELAVLGACFVRYGIKDFV